MDAVSPVVLELADFGVAFAPKVVLASVTMRVESPGVTVVIGPSGTGKSTLLRTLAGLSDAHPTLRTWGQATYRGRPLAAAGRPAIQVQNTRLLVSSVFENLVSALPNRSSLTRAQQRTWCRRVLEDFDLRCTEELLDTQVIDLSRGVQRLVALARVTLDPAPLVLLDEPTAGLEDEASELVLRAIEQVARARALLVVTHHMGHARRLARDVVFLAGGRVVESGEAEAFFREPRTEEGKTFLRTGGCRLPSPMAAPHEVEPDVPYRRLDSGVMRVVQDPSRPRAPVGFHWLVPGRLAGTPRPGLLRDAGEDLDLLGRLSVKVLLCLEERNPFTAEELAPYGLRPEHFPIPDMDAPSVDEMAGLCRRMDEWLARGEGIVAHCRGGLGRTGTVLVAYLVWGGELPADALRSARAINASWVQSERQLAFLETFGRRCAEGAPGGPLRGRGSSHVSLP